MSAVLPYRPSTSDETTSYIARHQAKRLATFAAIILFHAGLFYALKNGMTQHVVKLPEAVFATLLPPETSRPAPQPAPMKPIAPPKLTMPKPTPAPIPDIAVPSMAAAPSVATKDSVTTATAPTVPTAPAQPPITAPAQPKTISTVEYVQPPQPEYPSMSRRMGEQGKVMLRILVNEKGRPEHIDIQRSSGFPRLDEAARAAASRALFKPYVEDGRAMPVYVVVPIGFQLD